MARIGGVDSIIVKLRRLAKQAGSVSVVVGYTANYALIVHENLEMFHRVGQAKYLEQPAREMRGELANIINKAMKGGATLQQSLILAGLRLQRESQKLVPVDTGNLKGSAFTKAERI